MRIKHETKRVNPEDAVAFKFHMLANPEEMGLCIRIANINKAIWLYSDGDSSLGAWEPEVADVLFYEGDKIEITF